MSPRDFLVRLDMMNMCSYRVLFLYVNLWRGDGCFSFLKGALWLSLNMRLYMCSDQDTEQAYEIWKSSEHVESSYEGLKFHGETSKFTTSPQQPGMMSNKAFDNLSSPMSQYVSVWIWSGWDELSRTSSFKYEAWKWPKNSPKLSIFTKMADFLLDLG